MPAEAGRTPLLSLPGFLPDASPLATRPAPAPLPAHPAAFAAGTGVGPVAQSPASAAASKARCRMSGTVGGRIVAMPPVSAVPQNRTALPAGCVLRTGSCAFAAALPRHFRSYAAGPGGHTGGYTGGIVAVAVIDAAQAATPDAVDRVGARSIGVGAVVPGNHSTAGTSPFNGWVRERRGGPRHGTAQSLDALEERLPPGNLPPAHAAGIVSREQTETAYAAAEPPDGRTRANGYAGGHPW